MISTDFTVNVYRRLLKRITESGYEISRFDRFYQSENTPRKTIILRHDVDAKKYNSLEFAKIQYRLNIAGTYYFRIVPASYDETVIRQISALGHEIGYHYETMDTANGNVDRAYDEFCRNLEKFRKIVPITTVCMHGSPLSKFDNRAIWEKYDYRNLGIIAEPYFDLDFNSVLYLTDTGRRWDGAAVSVRDKAMAGREVTNPEFLRRKYHTTNDIINAINSGNFPDKAMFNFHPQRWANNPFEWVKELALQSVKNRVKSLLVKHRNRSQV